MTIGRRVALNAGADANLLTVGQETLPRDRLVTLAITISSGSLRLTYFTARKSETSTQGRMYSGSTAAAATPTLCRWGLYSIESSGDGTLVASIANDTTLFAAANTGYLRSWSSSIDTVAGQRYAWGAIVVSGAATPTYVGTGTNGGAYTTIAATAPRLAGIITGQTDLPSSFTAGSVATAANYFYAELLP